MQDQKIRAHRHAVSQQIEGTDSSENKKSL